MAESVVGFLINQLSTLLAQETTLLGQLKPDLQFIKDELSSMKAFLREAEAKEDNDSQLQEWVKQVREVAYDTEDVLDDFTFRFDHGCADGFCGQVEKIYNSIKNLKASHRISSEIKEIKARVGEISARHQRYQSLYVVSVVGMGGLGKTTLVKKVYDDTAVKKQFQSHAWITVSQNFQFNIIIKDLIQQLYNEIKQPIPPQVESMNVIMLSEFVKDFLRERRYILVLDDMWSIDAWEAIKCVLPDCNTASSVVLTTRIADVASASCLGSLDFVYKMKPLSDKESWALFCNRTFQSNDCPPNLEEVSKKIMKKCEGLPLAIVAMGDPLTTSFLSKFLRGGPKLLKVLDLDGAELDNIPKEVFKLFQLKCLGLCRTKIKIIPKSIRKLKNLEVLALMETSIKELPVEIVKLRKLRSLSLGGSADSDETVREIGKLMQLRRLSITKLRGKDGKELLSSLLRLTNLQELCISCFKEDETLDFQHSISPKLGFLTLLWLNGRLERVPQWVISLQSLSILRLYNSGFREDENAICSLGCLPSLVILGLIFAYDGETLCFKNGGFRKLQTLELMQFKRLKWMRVEEESLPSLKKLNLVGCKLMQELPSGIQNLTTLQCLGFYDMSDELMQRVQNLDKQSEDYQTIAHIPEVCTGYWIDGRWEKKFL
ncbi:unnamed protein product [Coffea canephora]|uniref:Disease resistance protein RPM1-like n=1 Tax=Coffea canephora TaxID=49390 RepID=A0A068UA59_COFCA|nr:unnamed protein product [Coffea canephora]